MTEANNAATVTGLSSTEAQQRLRNDGYNELPGAQRRTLHDIALEVLREPMFLLLMAGGTVYLLLGDVHEALVLLSFVFVIMTITFLQERKTAHALDALRELSSPQALVIRDGRPQRIPGREVVRGDVVRLSEGDRIPADAVVVESTNLSTDESLLTGESQPVFKVASLQLLSMERPGGENRPFVYSGTLVVQGQGIAYVMATGVYSEIGRIGHALRDIHTERSPLQRQTRQLLMTLALIGLGLCLLATIAYGITRGHWLDGILVGITLAMAILPDEFAVVLVVFMALGAWRLARQHVLTRQIPAIETLGAATVLCVDKTGTLTMNRMSAQVLYNGYRFFYINPDAKTLPDDMHEVVEFGILASQRNPFDPMERAMKELGERDLAQTEHLHHDWELIHEYPLSPELMAMSHVWGSPSGDRYVVAAKGAPEAVADLCHLRPEQCQQLTAAIRVLADAGLRVIGVARAYFHRIDLPQKQHDFVFEFIGLIGLRDPIRPTVPAAMEECKQAGVRVVMITGDYPGTAQHVAREIGLPHPERYLTGTDLTEMGEEELQRRIRVTNIFARVVPEQKLLLVNALKANGEIVAMTGDGVNDAPALKAAHIGIAMGGRGTDVAREAASLVLLDDDFSSIVTAIRMGRRVYANLNKAMAYILAIHIPIAGMTLIPVLLDWPLVLFPVHIAFLHLIIDPASSVAYEAEPGDANLMRRPPRDPQAPLFNHQAITFSLLQGCGVLASVLTVFTVAFIGGQEVAVARSLMFTTLIIANISLILVNRSWTKSLASSLAAHNTAIWWIILGAVVMLVLVLYLPMLRSLFRFTPLSSSDILLCLVFGILSVVWFEGVKYLQRRRGEVLTPAPIH